MDENAIIEGMARGDQRAFRELVERYKKKVYYLALDMAGNPVDAEDISQEVFLKVFRSFATFRKGAKLGSWLYRVTYNASIDHLRRKGAAPEPVADEVIESSGRSDAGLPRRRRRGPRRGPGIESAPGPDRPRLGQGLAPGKGRLRAPPLRRPHAQGHRRVPRPVRRVGQELSFPGRPQAPEGARNDGPYLTRRLIMSDCKKCRDHMIEALYGELGPVRPGPL